MPDSVAQGSRELGSTYGIAATLFASSKCDGIVAPDGPLEKTIGQLASLDPRVAQLKCQPFTIDLVSGELLHSRTELLAHREVREKSKANEREYTPDFCFSMINGKQYVVEVKNNRFLPSESYWAKVEKAKSILHQHGYRFAVVSLDFAADLPIVQNAGLLTSFQSNYDGDISTEQIESINAFLGDATLRLEDVLQHIGLALRDAPILLLKGIVATDLTALRLGTKSVVTAMHGDLQHLSVLSFDEGRS